MREARTMFTQRFQKNKHKATVVGMAYVTNTLNARKRTFERTVYEFEGDLVVMMNGNARDFHKVGETEDGHLVGWV